MKQLAFVAIGGMIGASLRYLISLLTKSFYEGDFPFATLFINVLGCFFIGLIYSNFNQNNSFEWIKPLLITGVLGGFTTFSAFSYEGIQLFQSQKLMAAIIYIVLSNSLGLIAAYSGTFIQLSK
ncbi:MAG: fluoride efflux transporter CrcB [Bacteroidia bacterium]